MNDLQPYPDYQLVINNEVMQSNDVLTLQNLAASAGVNNYSITLNGKEVYSQEIE